MKNDIIAMGALVKRSIKIFLKDKAAVFFSLLAPFIILLLYVLFLGDMNVRSLEESFAGTGIDNKLLRSAVDSWMLSGVIAVACITVSFSAHNIMIRDREEGMLADTLTAPVKRWVINFGYLAYNYIVTLVICTIVLAVSLIYLAIAGWYLSVGDVFMIIGTMLVSIISSSLFSTIVCSFFKTGSAHGAFVGILSAASGFLMGAYIPLEMFPKAVQYIVLFVPGTYSAGIFRNLFMSGAVDKIGELSPIAAQEIQKNFSMNLDFFGISISSGVMWGIFLGTILLFVALNLILISAKSRKNMNISLRKKRNKLLKND